MTLEHDAGDWPWSYRAEQTVRVDPDALTVSLSIQNLSSDAMPIGIGFHPYFPRRDGMRIKVDCEGVWETDPGDPGLPVNWNRVSPNASFRGSQAVAGLDVDNCFTGWNGHLHLEYPDTALLVSLRASDALGNLVIFCPKNSDFLCLEPVSHVTDAINMLDVPVGQAMDLLAPGERFSAEIRLSARYSQ
jgi:aldose 1-epimerase